MFTLVRHNMWTVDEFPQFRRGLQPLAVGPFTAAAVLRLGGVILRTEGEAWDAAEGFMYPLGDTTIPADPAGSFLEILFLRQPLFVPEFSGDLMAA